VTTAAAHRPPPAARPSMAERCLRTQFISPMCGTAGEAAPRLMRCLSCQSQAVRAGSASAEPPPEMRHNTRSSAVRPWARAKHAPGSLPGRRHRAPGGQPRRPRCRREPPPAAAGRVAVAGDHQSLQRRIWLATSASTAWAIGTAGLAGTQHHGAARLCRRLWAGTLPCCARAAPGAPRTPNR